MQIIQKHLLVLLFLDKEPSFLNKQLRPQHLKPWMKFAAFEKRMRTTEWQSRLAK